jgi:hypothetical protein
MRFRPRVQFDCSSDGLASFGSTPRRTIVVTIVTVFVASFLNWGFGLGVAGLLTREMPNAFESISVGGGGRLFGMDDFFQRILQFDSPLASNSRFKPEHRTESHRSGLATGVDASYSSESGNRFAFISRAAAPVLRDSAKQK